MNIISFGKPHLKASVKWGKIKRSSKMGSVIPPFLIRGVEVKSSHERLVLPPCGLHVGLSSNLLKRYFPLNPILH